MSSNRMDVPKFMKTLREITNDAVMERILLAEQTFHSSAINMHGFVALSRAFKSLVLDTVNLSPTWKESTSLSQVHAWLLPRMAGSFHTVCGAERAAMWGYPGPAFALLRNVFDSTVVSSAVAQGFATFMEAEGLFEGEPLDPRKLSRRRKDCEFAINARMVGKDSGLSEVARRELGKLNQLYDFETHGQRMTATTTMSWLKGQDGLHFLPRYEEMNYAVFVNRFSEVTWMLHRLLPLVWPAEVAANEDWCRRWGTLDQCFRQTVESLTVDLKKAVGHAIVEFVDSKFPFNGLSRLPK